jgi:trehalose 6-phosphate synthase
VTTIWNARWLKSALRRHFDGQQLIVVANREPCVHELAPDGSIATRQPISGLVTALDPVLRATGGTWIAHGSGSADRALVDRFDRLEIGDPGGRYTLRRVWLTRGEERGYYHGFSNGALWPLCHLAFESPRFTRSDWRHYQDVNRRFADAVVAEARGAHPIVLVQDYHFALLPALVRERLPGATVVAFWHIPWPNPARFSRMPDGAALLAGLLGSDIVGFQTAEHGRAFLDCVEALPDAAVDRVNGLVGRSHGAVVVRPYPISIEWPNRWAAAAPSIEECRRAVRAELGIEADAPMMVSVDRLDYTKGIEERLTAIRRLLARGNATVARPVFVQVASPSRTRLERYQQLAERVRAQTAAINERHGGPGYQPVVLIERQLEPGDVFRLFRAADACHVNSLDDGMNLVAKEFVAARDDGQGVLLLSRFAGAARELCGAIPVNPCDIDGVADAIADALTLPPDDQARRMRAMRRQVAERNVFRWAGELLMDAAAVRGTRAGEDPVAATG